MSHFEVRAHQRPLAASQRLKETLEPARLLAWVETQMRACIELERELEDRLCAVHPGARESARNLIHYLALRREDLRSIQPALAELGLSSLGRSEGHTLANLDAIAACLGGLLGKEPGEADPLGASSVTLQRGRALLDDATHRLLGDAPKGRIVRIMVTLPTEAAIEPALIGRLLDAGMTIARINSAHDSQEQWERMCQHVRAESARRGTHCRILFDLAVPIHSPCMSYSF